MTDMTEQYLKDTLAVETANAKEMIAELADDLERIGHSGKNIFEWLVDEAIDRGKEDSSCAFALRQRAENLES